MLLVNSSGIWRIKSSLINIWSQQRLAGNKVRRTTGYWFVIMWTACQMVPLCQSTFQYSQVRVRHLGTREGFNPLQNLKADRSCQLVSQISLCNPWKALSCILEQGAWYNNHRSEIACAEDPVSVLRVLLWTSCSPVSLWTDFPLLVEVLLLHSWSVSAAWISSEGIQFACTETCLLWKWQWWGDML